MLSVVSAVILGVFLPNVHSKEVLTLSVDFQKLATIAAVLSAFALYLSAFKVQIDCIIFDKELAEAEGIDAPLTS